MYSTLAISVSTTGGIPPVVSRQLNAYDTVEDALAYHRHQLNALGIELVPNTACNCGQCWKAEHSQVIGYLFVHDTVEDLLDNLVRTLSAGEVIIDANAVLQSIEHHWHHGPHNN
jgi:hypothetical protein